MSRKGRGRGRGRERGGGMEGGRRANENTDVFRSKPKRTCKYMVQNVSNLRVHKILLQKALSRRIAHDIICVYLPCEARSQ